MTAFDRAWAVVKMARHILSDDIEIWDPSGLGEANWTYYPEGRGGEWNKIPEG